MPELLFHGGSNTLAEEPYSKCHLQVAVGALSLRRDLHGLGSWITDHRAQRRRLRHHGRRRRFQLAGHRLQRQKSESHLRDGNTDPHYHHYHH